MPPNKEDKRSALLQAALELFAEQGFNAAPTALIAKRAGVASGTLFFHFRSKEELIRELFREVRQKIEGAIEEELPAETPIRERLFRLLSNLLRFFLDHPAEFKFIEQHHYSIYSDHGCSQPEENAIHNLLLRAREQQIIKDAPLFCLEAVAFGPIAALVKEHASRGTPVDEKVRRLIIEACWDGLKR